MALGALTLSVTTGVQGRPFSGAIQDLTTGKVKVLGDGSPGFSTVNRRVTSAALPYDVNTVVLREYEPSATTSFRDSRIESLRRRVSRSGSKPSSWRDRR